ncbi:hypothetical protein EXIGLDRAFT_147618 [Exidia glandulosa HHB12029]|uniref:F-box domain-containing protein n=1 Tax=Exidia glandulosa HHB12029 TaxID=1314781 RepID=A0A165FS05_EXIGL|nr:hypothetical protein EXIGLDRAFT_147618 [Exidia glandulosa HHB12029]
MSKHVVPDDEEMYSDGDEEYSDDSDQEESDDDGDQEESDGDDDFSPDQSLPQLPAHLKLPIELELRVLDFFGTPWDDLWLNMRRVCTAWRDHIEARARNKWIRRAQLHFANPPDFALKLITTSSWKFQRLEEDGTAVLQDTDCAEEYKKRVIRECKQTGDPDIILGHYVFDIEVRSLRVPILAPF